MLDVQMLIPGDTPHTGGNQISAERVQGGLARIGITARVARYDPLALPEAQIYHAWNAVRVGLELVARGVPTASMVVTWTGTDLWQDWVNHSESIRRGLEGVRSQVVFTPDARQLLIARAPEWADRIELIPPSVDVETFSPYGLVALSPRPLILVAGGIRPVKRSAWAIDLVEALREASGKDIHLAIAGPVRERGEGERVAEKAASRPWVRLLGEVPKQEMGQWYRAATLVLNCSEVEGVSNALMEAMACGALVAATDIPGNRSLVEPGLTGVLFDTVEEFVERVQDNLRSPAKARFLRVQARQLILEQHNLVNESGAYRALYERAMGCLCWR